jgi:hypothetical protein
MIPRKNLLNVFVILETLLGIVMLIFLIMSIFLSLSTIVVGSFLIGIMFGLLLATREKLRLNYDRGTAKFVKRIKMHKGFRIRKKAYEGLMDPIDYINCPSVKDIMWRRERIIAEQKTKEYRNKNQKYKKR